MDLILFLSSLPDFRRAQGKRYPLPFVLMLIMLALANRCLSYRQMADFMKDHAKAICDMLGILPGSKAYGRTPTHETLRTIMTNLDTIKVSTIYNHLFTVYVEKSENQFVALDGKSLSCSVADSHTYQSSEQNNSYVVSAYMPDTGQVIGHQSADAKQCSEATTLRQLLEQLCLQSALLSVDAGHCSKKL